MTRLALALALLSGCAASPEEKKSSPGGAPPPSARACRPLDGAAQKEDPEPPAGTKRFELRTGRGLDPQTILVDGRPALEKRLDLPDPSCVYLDLPPGRHQVQLRATAKEPMLGMNPSLAVAEYGVTAGRWYGTFRFVCGGREGEACLKDDIKESMERYRAVPRGLHDPCGSTRVEAIKWAAERSPEVKLEDLQLDFTLNVYAFAPREPPGSAECGKHPKGGPAE